MFFLTADEYNYSDPITLSLIPDDVILTVHCPLDIDTEFCRATEFSTGDDRESMTLTVQIKPCYEDGGGLILAHPDNLFGFGEHSMVTGFAPIDYLRIKGHDVELERYTHRHKLPVMQFDLFAFFAVAELYRIVSDDYVKDIDDLVRSTNPKTGQIKMGRRLTTSTIVKGNRAEPWVKMPWKLTIDGKQFQVALRFFDTCAVHGTGNYKAFCTNSGVHLEYKDVFTKEEKGRMLEMMLSRPDDFRNYALGDLNNHKALLGFQERSRNIHSTLGLNDYFVPPRLTTGATVCGLIRSSLLHYIGLPMDGKKQLIEICRYGTAAWIRENQCTTTGVYNAKVDGGRCRNNRPTIATTNKLIVDIDIAGCYGNGLKNQEYPIGRPVTIDYPIKSDWNEYLTLRQFLNKYRKQFVPGLWQARVSTIPGYELKHGQDFLVSWYPPKNPTKIPTDTELAGIDWFTEDNPGITKIFTREVHLAIIQEDFLDWLDNSCALRQRKELLDNLVVNCAAFYPKKERCNTPDEFFRKVAEFKGSNTCKAIIKRGATKVIKIHRECHSWFSANLGDLLVNKLLEERGKYSKKNPEEAPLNNLYKLFTNTIYGDMVSPFFDIGNVVVGNNITARARTMAWYMEKGLHGYQSITDGCAFEPNRVVGKRGNKELTSSVLFEAYVNEKRPHYRFTQLGNKGGIKYSINEENKVELTVAGKHYTYAESLHWLAEKATIHLKEQFPGIRVLEQFNFEIKDIYTSASFHGTANYKFWIGDQGQKAKMRSYRKDGYESYLMKENELLMIDEEYSPSEDFLTALRDNPKQVLRQKTYIDKKILKPSEYSKNYNTSWKHSKAFPGCTVSSARLLRECSLTQFTFRTKQQFDSWEREQKRLRDKYGQSYEQWFLTTDDSLNFQEMIERLDELIRQGHLNFTTTLKAHKHRNLSRYYQHHPEHQALLQSKERIDTRYGRQLSRSQEYFDYELQ